MEYTIKKLTVLAGISARTLRYYDQIGLLKPIRVQSSGYRVYGQAEVDRLQAIMVYRELGFKLEEIKAIIDDPSFDSDEEMFRHRNALLMQKERLDTLIMNVEKTMRSRKGLEQMSDKEKFEGFKEDRIRENERNFGTEIEKTYGKDKMQESNRKLMQMSHEKFERMQAIEDEIKTLLKRAVSDQADPKSETGKKIAFLHKEWLGFTWPTYSSAAHLGLVDMYVEDERFTTYYDKEVPGCARFLKDAVTAWLIR